MPIEKVRILSLMVLGSSYITWSFGDYGPYFFLFQLLAILPLWFPLNLERIRQLPIWKALGLAALLFFAVSAYMSRWEVGIFVLVLFCLIYEFYGETRERAPLRLISLVSFLIIVYMGNVDTDLSLLIGLSQYIFTIVLCLMIFYLGEHHSYHIIPILKNHYATLLRAVVFSMILGLLLFWILPRSERQSLTTLPTIGGNHISGLSDRVSLNDIGSMKLSRKHVMDIKPMDGYLHSNYLKGRTMDHYEDGTWSTIRQSNGIHQSSDLVFDFWSIPPGVKTYSYSLEQEPMFGNNLFFFDTLVRLEGRLHPLKVEGPLSNLSVIRNKPLTMTYTMVAADQPTPSRRDFDQRPYLSIPANHEYLADLCQTILGDRQDMEVRATAQALKEYFARNFKYSLDINNGGQQDPLKYFLFSARAGHCELFASSMVLMLRSQGIPARLATGFLVPEIHPSGEFYYITESDAHAWVEYEDGDYWYTLDPTPPATFTSPSFFESTIAVLDRWWRNQVVTFDFEAQKNLYATIISNLEYMIGYFWNRPWMTLMILSVFCVPLLFFRIIPLPFSRETRVIKNYRRLEQQLNEHYRQRGVNEGIYDYVSALGLEGGLELDLLHFFRCYHSYRFALTRKMPAGELVAMGSRLIKRISR